MALNYIKALCLFVIVLSLFTLSLTSFEYAKFKKTNQFSDLSKWNLHTNSRNTNILKLDNRISELKGVLEYMVWPAEHEKVSKTYLLLLKQKIILKPNQSKDWQYLVAEFYRNKLNANEMLWSLNNAIEFNKWKVKSRPWLAYYCIKLNHLLDTYSQQNCNNLIKQLPLSIDRNHLANMIGIDRQGLDFAIEKAGLPSVAND